MNNKKWTFGLIAFGISLQCVAAFGNSALVSEYRFEEETGVVSGYPPVMIGNRLTGQMSDYIQRVPGLEGRLALKVDASKRKHGDNPVIFRTDNLTDSRAYTFLFKADAQTVGHGLIMSQNLRLYVHANKLKLYQPYGEHGQWVRRMVQSRVDILPGITYEAGVVIDPQDKGLCLYVNGEEQACTMTRFPMGNNDYILMGNASAVYDRFRIYEGNPYELCNIWLQNGHEVARGNCQPQSKQMIWVVKTIGYVRWTRDARHSTVYQFLNNPNLHGTYEVFLSDQNSARNGTFNVISNVLRFTK